MQDFFSREWDSLRELMHKLEDCDWSGVELTPPTEEQRSSAPAFRDLLVSQLNTQAQVSHERARAQQARLQPPVAAAPATPQLVPVPQQSPGSTVPVSVPAVIDDESGPALPFDEDRPAPLAADPTPAVISTPETGRLADLAKRLEGKLKRRAEDG